MTTKGLTCYILRDSLGDCSNGGLSSRVNQVTLIDAPGPFEPSAKAPAVRLVHRVICGRPYVHAEPVDQPPKGTTAGPMFGGCYITTSDGRFPNDYPIPLHDRFEGWAQYQANSD